MTIRENLEQMECTNLSPYACLSKNSKGREREEKQCDIRPVFQRDRDRILHSKSFRRLMHKTQVFLFPADEHYRTRMTHTLEVTQVARIIARALQLNEDLAEAAALGHDLGHTPFGHTGEAALAGCLARRRGIDVASAQVAAQYRHNEQSLRVVERIENDGRGLNLTAEVRDGILNHRTSGHPNTLEGQAVRFADKIAYINHDIDDSIRAGLIREEEIPSEISDILGHSVKDRLSVLIHDVIYQSKGQPLLSMSAPVEQAMQSLREWMFTHVYIGGEAKQEEVKVRRMMTLLFQYYMDHPESMTEEFITMLESNLSKIASDDPEKELKRQIARERSVCDYIAGMTDDYCIYKFKEYFVPVGWQKF